MTCREICRRSAVKRPYGQPYYEDHRHCSVCDVWFRTRRIRCECCNRLLKYSPRKLRRKVARI